MSWDLVVELPTLDGRVNAAAAGSTATRPVVVVAVPAGPLEGVVVALGILAGVLEVRTNKPFPIGVWK